MRIAYSNLFDNAASITPSTETTLYEATMVQDQRLTTQWRTTAATDQTIIFAASADTIVGGNIGLVTGSAATNLVNDPENMTSGDWALGGGAPGSRATATSILGVPAYKMTSGNGTGTAYLYNTVSVTATGQQVISIVARYSDSDDCKIFLWDASEAEVLVNLDIDFTDKSLAYNIGTEAMAPVWIDDRTVRVFAKGAASSVGNNVQTWLFPDKDSSANMSTIFSAPMVIDNTYPVPYVETTRAAVATTHATRVPPSGKFIVDCEFKLFSPFDLVAEEGIWSWYTSVAQHLYLEYIFTTDTFNVTWKDGGAQRTLSTGAMDAATLNVYNRITADLNLSVSDADASTLYLNGVAVDSAWSAANDILSASTFTTLEQGTFAGDNRADAIFRFLRIYGGNFATAETITTTAQLDTALANRQLVFAQDSQNQFNLDTVAIMGHNISEDAAIKVELNDWDEWNYTDGSGSSIIQEVLTWDDETILKMFTKVKRQYVKFTINDPNNDDGIIKIGRIWGGPYLDISPSSLDDFTVTKKRSDRNIYGINRQKWSDTGVGWREFNLSFPRTEATMLNSIQTMYDEVGTHSSLIFANFDTLRSWPIVEPLYCSIVGEITMRHRGRQKYEYSLRLEEDK
jgi:hypothetical protein